MVAEVCQQHPLAHLRAGGDDCGGGRRHRLRQTSGEKSASHKESDGRDERKTCGGEHPPGEPSSLPFREFRLEPRPDHSLETVRGLGWAGVLDRRQELLQAGVSGAARAALGEVLRRRSGSGRIFAVVMQHQVVVSEMHGVLVPSVHQRSVPVRRSGGATSGSSATRIFFTALKMLCFVAFVFRPERAG